VNQRQPPKVTESLITALRDRNLVVGTAESLTGGLICAELTGIPGSSDCVRGSIVAYSSDVKMTLLGVTPNILAEGVVSEPVAIAMAQGALQLLGADLVISCTGVAGPGPQAGISPGTVWLACASHSQYLTKKHVISGDREQVRTETVKRAIDLIAAFLLVQN